MSLPISRRKNDGYKVPLAYTTNVLRGCYLFHIPTRSLLRAYIHWEKPTSLGTVHSWVWGWVPVKCHRRGARGGAADTLPSNYETRERERTKERRCRKANRSQARCYLNQSSPSNTRFAFPNWSANLLRWFLNFFSNNFLLANISIVEFCFLLGK